MEERVGVLLRVGDPGDGVDPRQQLLDGRAVRRLERVDVRQVEDHDAARAPGRRGAAVHRHRAGRGAARRVAPPRSRPTRRAGPSSGAGPRPRLTTRPASALSSSTSRRRSRRRARARRRRTRGPSRSRASASTASAPAVSSPSPDAAPIASSSAARQRSMPLASRRTAPSCRRPRAGDRRSSSSRVRGLEVGVAGPPRPVRRRATGAASSGTTGWSARDVVAPRRAGVRRGRAARRRRRHQPLVPRQLLVERRGERLDRAAPARRPIISTSAASPNSASSSFWLRNAVAAATPTSAPVIPPVCANVASITPIPAALTPTEAPFGRGAACRRPSPGRPRAIQSTQPSRRPVSARRSAATGPTARDRRRPRRASRGSSAQSAAVRRAASAAWDRASATMSASASSRTSATGARGVPRMSAESVPRTLPMPLENSRVTSSAPDERLPLAERLGAQERAAGRGRSRRAASSRLERGPWRSGGARRPRSPRAPRRRPRARRAGPSPARLPASARAARARRASAVPAEGVDPGAERRDGVGGERVDRASSRAPSADRRGSATASASGSVASRPRASTPNAASRRSTSSRTSTRSAASAGIRLTTTTSGSPRSRARSEDVPRHAVGVAGGGRDEDAEVGGLGEAVGQLPVRVLDRVDVGRIDERDPARRAVVLHDPQPVAGERRQRRALAQQRLAVARGGRGRRARGSSGRRTPDGLTRRARRGR